MDRSTWRLALSFLAVATVLSLVVAPRAYADNDGAAAGIGVEWVGQYVGTGAPAANFGNLDTVDECLGGLYNIAADSATDWLWDFNWGNELAWELDWKAPRAGGDASAWADNVDLVAFSGHGLGNNFQFNNHNNDWVTTIGDLDLGLRDCEWALTYTCNFLHGSPSDYGVAANGVHLICGYATDMTITANGGSWFAYWATSSSGAAYPVRVAWYKYGQNTQSGADENTARTFGAVASVNDYLWGYGPVSADPPPYGGNESKYAYWSTKLNW